MVISVSGTVGSGKSTAASGVADAMRRHGQEVALLRFQKLPCFTVFRTRLSPPVEVVEGFPEQPVNAIRWANYTQKPLGPLQAAVYLARMIAFRIYRARWSGDRVYVLNRYFYDLFAHYRLATNAERFWLRLLRAAMPVPDLAIVVLADVEALAARRPEYAPEYLAASSAAYSKLRRDFPNLVELRNDAGVADLTARLEQLLPGGGTTPRAD